MKRFLTFSSVIIAPVMAAVAFGFIPQAQGGRVPVKVQTREKIIYDVTGASNPLPLEADCARRGGTFFAAACPECAPYCAFQADERLVVPGWVMYRDEGVGVTLNHPESMAVHKNRPTEVSLRMWGPTQTQSGDLSDGVWIRVSRESYPPVLSFDEYVEQRILDVQAAGQEILSAAPVTVGRLSGESFRAFKGRETTYLLFPLENHQALTVASIIIDPGKERFDRVADRLISSLRIL